MAVYLPLTSSNPLGTFQTGCVAGAEKAFYSEPELELPKIRRLQLRKSYKLRTLVSVKSKGRLTLINAVMFEMHGDGVDNYILPGSTGTFHPEPELGQSKTSHLRLPVFENSARQRWIQGL